MLCKVDPPQYTPMTSKGAPWHVSFLLFAMSQRHIKRAKTNLSAPSNDTQEAMRSNHCRKSEPKNFTWQERVGNFGRQLRSSISTSGRVGRTLEATDLCGQPSQEGVHVDDVQSAARTNYRLQEVKKAALAERGFLSKKESGNAKSLQPTTLPFSPATKPPQEHTVSRRWCLRQPWLGTKQPRVGPYSLALGVHLWRPRSPANPE